MTPQQPTVQDDARQDPFRWQRCAAAHAYADFSDPFSPPSSQRAYAREHGIPRSTLGDWLRREDPAGVDPTLAAFLRSPSGEAFLRRLLMAVLLVFHHMNACGLRPISFFLELIHIDRFVGSSYGALRRLAVQLQVDLAAFGDEERLRMAKLMPKRTIALTPDENFHGTHPCLVAIEPVSNFILVEQYAQHRDAETWTEAIQQATQDLPVTVVAVTGDQAKGIIACAGRLDAHYTPELFHGQRDLARPLVAPLQRQIASAEKEAEAAPPRPGRPADFEWRILLAKIEEGRKARQLQECVKRKEQACDALRGLADDYHPFEPQTGQPLSAEQVQERLLGRLKTLERVTCITDLGKAAEEALEKGKKWMAALVASMAWFWVVARQRVEELALPEEAEQAMQEKLLAGLYWQQAARRARTAEEKQEKEELAARLVKEAWAADGALMRLKAEEREQVQRVAAEVVGLFARSSSCVEGRNGRLALLHHGHTRLSTGHLKALSVVHNYVARRTDGSTAAERFFGVKQRDAFAWLLERMPDLPQPAAKRAQQPPRIGPAAA
jgi:hypothetical protein